MAPPPRRPSRTMPGASPASPPNQPWRREKSVCYHMATARFSTEASDVDSPTEAVQEQYQKMLKSVEAETMPPHAWLWSMISSCSNKEDIKLLFQILQKLRVFRHSNIRINANFNDHLCMKVTEACARVGTLDYGLKALWKHNVYGITPTIGSAHYLLQHAKEHSDTKLMESIMQILMTNFLPLQPGTADIVFSICYNADRWDLLSKYAERFVKAGVKLHLTAFDIWMEFAAKVGGSQAIWNINSLRGKFVENYTFGAVLAFAKGFLLERHPESAPGIIKLVDKLLHEQNKLFIKDELQKLIAEWPKEVIKKQKKDDRKIFLVSPLQSPHGDDGMLAVAARARRLVLPVTSGLSCICAGPFIGSTSGSKGIPPHLGSIPSSLHSTRSFSSSPQSPLKIA